MTGIQKLIPKESLIRLTDDGFVSTARYCDVFTRSTALRTCDSADPERLVDCPGHFVSTRQPLAHDRGYGIAETIH